MPAEITDSDRAKAIDLVGTLPGLSDWCEQLTGEVAQTLADQREELTAAQITEYAIEFHYFEGPDGWRRERTEDGRNKTWPDRETADRNLARRRENFGNDGRDWARLVRRTVGPWEQVEG